MLPIGRIIFEAADRSGYYAHPWDGTTAVVLLPGGSMTVQQGGQTYTYTAGTTPAATSDAAPLAYGDVVALAAKVDAALAVPTFATISIDGHAGTLVWIGGPADTPPTVTVTDGAGTQAQLVAYQAG